MLGYDTSVVGAPYRRIVVVASAGAFLLAIGCVFILRAYYLPALEGLDAVSGSVLPMLLLGACSDSGYNPVQSYGNIAQGEGCLAYQTLIPVMSV